MSKEPKDTPAVLDNIADRASALGVNLAESKAVHRSYLRRVACPACSGSGYVGGDHAAACTACGGKGTRRSYEFKQRHRTNLADLED